jgi:hypothetical protein
LHYCIVPGNAREPSASVLANENFPGAAIAALGAAGHDVLWVRRAAPGMILAKMALLESFDWIDDVGWIRVRAAHVMVGLR